MPLHPARYSQHMLDIDDDFQHCLVWQCSPTGRQKKHNGALYNAKVDDKDTCPRRGGRAVESTKAKPSLSKAVSTGFDQLPTLTTYSEANNLFIAQV